MSDVIDSVIGNGSDLSQFIAGLFIIVTSVTLIYLLFKIFSFRR